MGQSWMYISILDGNMKHLWLYAGMLRCIFWINVNHCQEVRPRVGLILQTDQLSPKLCVKCRMSFTGKAEQFLCGCALCASHVPLTESSLCQAHAVWMQMTCKENRLWKNSGSENVSYTMFNNSYDEARWLIMWHCVEVVAHWNHNNLPKLLIM